MGALMEVLVIRPLRDASPLAKLVATLGILLSVEAVILLRFGTTSQLAPPVLPTGLVTIFGVGVPQDRFWLAGIVAVAAAVLAVGYRRTRFGLSTRAAAENETVARLAGLSPNRLSMINTLFASLVAGSLGVLAAPLSQLDSSTIPIAVVPALGAALLARFTSFWVSLFAGLAMGMAQTLLIYLQTKSWFPTDNGSTLPGTSDLLFFIVIVIATYWRGDRIPDRGMILEKRLPIAPAAQRVMRPALAALAAIIVGGLLFPYDFRQALINTIIGIIVCLSLVVVTGLVGQVSLLQVALAGIAGFILARLAAGAGIGFPLGPLIGVLGATLFGLVTAVSALRVRGVNLAIVSLAAAVAVENFGFQNSTWGAGVAGNPVTPPHFLGLDLGSSAAFPFGASGVPSPVFVFLCGAAALAIGLFVANLRRSGLGKQMLAVRANERAAAGAGISVTRIKLAGFAISSAIAGLAGCLYAYNFGSVSSDSFSLILALMFVAYAYIGGITTVAGAVVGGLGVTQGLLGYAIDKWFGVPATYQLLVGGLLLVLTIVLNPAGIAGSTTPRKLLAQLRRQSSAPGSAVTVSPDIPDIAEPAAVLVERDR
jgi:branched-chain amino acid transport system permease protein